MIVLSKTKKEPEPLFTRSNKTKIIELLSYEKAFLEFYYYKTESLELREKIEAAIAMVDALTRAQYYIIQVVRRFLDTQERIETDHRWTDIHRTAVLVRKPVFLDLQQF